MFRLYTGILLSLLSLPSYPEASHSAEISTPSVEESAARPCIRLNRINLDDDQLNDKEQEKLFREYIGRCIDGALLKAVIADASGFYISRGNITTKPYLRKQTISDGQIDITVLKGTIENIVDASTNQSNARIKTAFAFQQGKLLNLRDLETALEMMNRPPSSDARFEIKPGSRTGTSVVAIKSQDTLPFHLSLGLTGRENLKDENPYLTAELSVDNPLNINDILTFRYNGSSIQQKYQSNRGGEINYSFPVASYLIEVVGSQFSYRQGVTGLNDTFLSRGDTQAVRLKVSKVLMRNQKNKLSAALSLYHKDTKNYFSDQLIDVSSYKTTLAQFDLAHTWLHSWGQLTTAYSYYQGTDWFGARNDRYFSSQGGAADRAKLQFKKHTLDLSLLYYLFNPGNQFSSSFHLQRSNDNLHDSDKLTVGSDYTVRGYLNRNLFGNNAWYVKNDLTKTWALNIDRSLLQQFSMFVGGDFGNVACEADNRGNCGKIYGAAAGFNTKSEHLETSFVWSQPLKRLTQTFKLRSLFKFDLTWRF